MVSCHHSRKNNYELTRRCVTESSTTMLNHRHPISSPEFPRAHQTSSIPANDVSPHGGEPGSLFDNLSKEDYLRDASKNGAATARPRERMGATTANVARQLVLDGMDEDTEDLQQPNTLATPSTKPLIANTSNTASSNAQGTNMSAFTSTAPTGRNYKPLKQRSRAEAQLSMNSSSIANQNTTSSSSFGQMMGQPASFATPPSTTEPHEANAMASRVDHNDEEEDEPATYEEALEELRAERKKFFRLAKHKGKNHTIRDVWDAQEALKKEQEDRVSEREKSAKDMEAL
jgi:hypothetical protein